MAATDLENQAAAALHSHCIDGFPYRAVVTADLFVIRKRHVVPLLFMDGVLLPLLMSDEPGNSRRSHVIGRGACRTHDLFSGKDQSRMPAFHAAKQRQQIGVQQRCRWWRRRIAWIHRNDTGMRSTHRQGTGLDHFAKATPVPAESSAPRRIGNAHITKTTPKTSRSQRAVSRCEGR
jgi:hypothetical protein